MKRSSPGARQLASLQLQDGTSYSLITHVFVCDTTISSSPSKSKKDRISASLPQLSQHHTSFIIACTFIICVAVINLPKGTLKIDPLHNGEP